LLTNEQDTRILLIDHLLINQNAAPHALRSLLHRNISLIALTHLALTTRHPRPVFGSRNESQPCRSRREVAHGAKTSSKPFVRWPVSSALLVAGRHYCIVILLLNAFYLASSRSACFQACAFQRLRSLLRPCCLTLEGSLTSRAITGDVRVTVGVIWNRKGLDSISHMT